MRPDIIFKKKFRPSSAYVLKEWNDLTIAERTIPSQSAEENDVYGFFLPVEKSIGLKPKMAYREVALLYLHLKQSVQLPHYLVSSDDAQIAETISQLVLEHILEIESNGIFVSGAAATEILYDNDFFDQAQIPDRLSLISMKAIDYAFQLRNADAPAITAKLYTFNTQVLDASQRAVFAANGTIKDWLFHNASAELKDLFDVRWLFVDSSQKAWLYWNRLPAHEKSDQAKKSFHYKLYISPFAKNFEELFLKCIPALCQSTAFSFKIGSTVGGLLRPDKMVVYFQDLQSLEATAALLEKETEAYPAQGVPFSKQLDKQGILSFGADIPGEQSWRIKLSHQIAETIVLAGKSGLTKKEGFRFLRAKLSGAGIDTNTWSPTKRYF